MQSEYITHSLARGVLTITLNRPKANALTHAMLGSLRALFKEAESNSQVRCVLLTASGNIFSAGHDLTEIHLAENQSFRNHLQQTYNPLILQIRQLEKPVLAAINGPVAGASLGLILACDLRIATQIPLSQLVSWELVYPLIQVYRFYCQL